MPTAHFAEVEVELVWLRLGCGALHSEIQIKQIRTTGVGSCMVRGWTSYGKVLGLVLGSQVNMF